MTLQEIDWTKLGKALRESADDAHEGQTPSINIAYDFLVNNPGCFNGEDEWPADMPQRAPIQLAYAYWSAYYPHRSRPSAVRAGEQDEAPSINNREVAMERIAREVLDLTTLERRGRDHLDFSDQAVWGLQRALEAAYDAGKQEPNDAEYIWINIGVRKFKDGDGWDLLCGDDKSHDVSGIVAERVMHAYVTECLDALQCVIDQAEPNVGDDRDMPEDDSEQSRYSGTPEHRSIG